ncbi:LptF/LptG family permease [Marinobacter sp.]|uniref:LptF/LptG family permease n=1 Tax=Marinobacter sp. TaxID=50741 RepID=UPI003A90630E
MFIGNGGRDGEGITLITAETGSQLIDEETGSRFLILEDGGRFQGVPASSIQRRSAYGLKIQSGEAGTKELEEGINARSLYRMILKIAPLHWRISLPLIVPIITLLAQCLSRVNLRQGRFFICCLRCWCINYLGLLIVARDALADGKVPEWLGMLWFMYDLLVAGLVAAIRACLAESPPS